MTTLEAIDSLSVTGLITTSTKGRLISGVCFVNEVKTLFGYDPKYDKFSSIVVFYEYKFGYLGENWLYRIGCTIKKAMS